MTEYIDLDTPLELKVARGQTYKPYTSTLRELLDINSIPYTDADVVERKHGKWDKDSDMAFYWKCSECGAYLFWRHEDFMVNGNPNYCPNCGSRMDLDGDTE